MRDTHTYSVDIDWLEGRKGIMESNVLDSKIEVATPPEFKGGIRGIWSPEHLFVAATASCFMTTFLAVAEKTRLEFVSFSCKASGILETKNNQVMISSITLQPLLKLADDDMMSKGLKTLEISHKGCLILNSVKSEIIFMPHVQCGNPMSFTSDEHHDSR